MVKINGNEIRKGNVIEHKNGLWIAVKTSHVKPGKGGAFAQVELKNIRTNSKLNERFRSADKVERVRLEQKDYQFLYKSDVDFNEIAELLAGVLKLGTLNINEKLSTPKFSDNFLTGYIYNFLESYKSLRYISSLTETKVEKISEQYFLKKNIFRFNLAILFLLIISLILINIKDLKKFL